MVAMTTKTCQKVMLAKIDNTWLNCLGNQLFHHLPTKYELWYNSFMRLLLTLGCYRDTNDYSWLVISHVVHARLYINFDYNRQQVIT
jgi:hypothetical protein